ncbi:MAG: putative metal-binding motif-containing protein [Sandaracinaceae bacterium]|nr:putative metal-binding motif-containing protein [Sandaracinaceae bacterium]
MQARFLLAVFLCAGCSCGSPVMPADGGGLPDGGRADASVVLPCAADTECADIDYCNGTERCLPGDPAADARGCVAGMDPCTTGQTCDEDLERCVDDTCPPDGDGDTITTCEGDCDDTRNDIHPGATEICVLPMPGAVDSTDEDCNPMTFGFVNADGDGAVSASCFNIDERTGMRYGGTDCDDSNPSVSPLAAEQCDGPDGVDENCNGSRDEGCACSPEGSTRPCGMDTGECTTGVEQCTASGWGTCSGTPPTVETCNHLDDSCDGMTDEGVGIAPCSTTFSTFDCFGATACADLSARVAGNQSPRAAYGRGFLGDFGRSNRFTATVRLTDTTANANSAAGNVALVVSPNPGVGAESTGCTPGDLFCGLGDGLPDLNPGESGVAALLASGQLLILLARRSGRWEMLSPSAVAAVASTWASEPCLTIPTAGADYTLELSNNGGSFTASVSRPGCGTAVTVTATDNSLWDSLYGFSQPFPRYRVGLNVDADGELYAQRISLGVQRRTAGSDRNNCVACL